jgi:hypothetical protein
MNMYFRIISILGFCILLRELYQGFQKNRPSQQLFKVFIALILRPLHVSAFIGHPHGEHTIYEEVTTLTTDPLYIVQILLYMFLANTAVV